MTEHTNNVSPALTLKQRWLHEFKQSLDRGGWTAIEEKLGKAFDEIATDGLTDLYTPRMFNRIIAQIIEPRIRRKYQSNITPLGAVVFIDIDRFKQLNSMFGHAGGDNMLRVFAKHLSDKFRISDLIGRIGGDEFVVIADGLSVDAVSERIENLRAELLHYPWKLERIDGGDRSVGCELGFTSKVVEISDPSVISEFIRKADIAVMQQKKDRD